MDQRRAAAALLALAACFACSTAAPTSNNNNQTALDIYDGPVAVEGCYYNFQHYGEGDRIMTNEPCLNCTCHNRMLMCYLRVCPFTKPIGQDCTVEKRADQCCPIVTCPDVPVDLLTSTSTTSPAEYGSTGLGKLDKYGCSINGKYFPEGSKVPPAPNKPCEHCYCIRNMTTCVMQECTLHVDGCTPIYHKDVCCPIRYSCDHEDEIPLLDDMTTTVRPTPGFLLTTTTMTPVTQASQECVHDDQIFPDGALIKTEKACEHCYCMKGDIVCVVQECGTPMENEGKNCVSLPPRQGQCCPDTYICEGDETPTTELIEETTTLTPPRRVGVEGSGYRNEPDEPYTGMPLLDTDVEGSGEDQLITTSEYSHLSTSSKDIPESTSEYIHLYNTEPDREFSTVQDTENKEQDKIHPVMTTLTPSPVPDSSESTLGPDHKPTIFAEDDDITKKQDDASLVQDEVAKTTLSEFTTKPNVAMSTLDNMTPLDEGFILATKLPDRTESTDSKFDEELTTFKPDIEEPIDTDKQTTLKNVLSNEYTTILTTSVTEKTNDIDTTTTINVHENEIAEDLSPGRIPGEGDCLLNGLTYKNNSVVPSTSKCHSSCKCVSSIIKCDPIICALPQEYMNDCYPIYDSPESCCPTYVCNTKETTAPESHSQMSGTEAPKPTIECKGDECSLNEESRPQEIPAVIECGENGCPGIDKSQKDSESCNNGKCETGKEPNTIPNYQVPCDSDQGCQVPVTRPCDGDNCKTEYEIPVHQESNLDDKPMEEDKEILCKEENCRRKEHSNVDQKVICSGSDCSADDIISPTVGLETSTVVSQFNEITTGLDMENKDFTEESNVIQDMTTLKPQSVDIEETASTGQTTRVPTTLFELSEQTQGSQEIINTQSSASSEVTTESIGEAITEVYNKNKKPMESVNDEVNIPSIEESEDKDSAVTESSEPTIAYTPQETEQSSTEFSTLSHMSSSTAKLETDSSETTKQITTESSIAMDTTKPGLTSEDITVASHENDIYHEQVSNTELPEITESPYEKEQTTITDSIVDVTSKIPMIAVTERDEIVTVRIETTTVSEEKITLKEESEMPKDETVSEVTESVERTTLKITVPETLESTTSSDSINTFNDKQTVVHETTTMYSDKEQPIHDITSKTETPDVLEITTMSSETSKEEEHEIVTTIPELLTTKEEKTFETSSTLAYSKESTEGHYEDEKITSNPLEYTTSTTIQQDNEKNTEHDTISTVLPELNTIPEESKTTPAIREHSVVPVTINDYETTPDTEIHTEHPTFLSTESDLYITPTHLTIGDKQENEQKITLSDLLEQQTEKINTVITTPVDATISSIDEITHKGTEATHSDTELDRTIITTEIINNLELDNLPTERIPGNEATTAKQIEDTYHYDTETKPSEGSTESIIDTKTTVPYSYIETTDKQTDTESPLVSDIGEKSTPSASYNEPSNDLTTAATTEVESGENIVDVDEKTEKPSKATDANVVTETNEYTEISNKVQDKEIVGDKPSSTVADLPQDYPGSTTTSREELFVSIADEMPTVEKHDHEDKEILTNTDRADIITSSDVYTDKPETTKVSDFISTEIHDLRDKPESTTEHIPEIITESVTADITDISMTKEKETETPMSLVTEPQSITSAPQKTIENVNPVTETNVVASTSSHDFTTKVSLETTVLDESQQNDKEVVTPEAELSTGYNYPKPSTESSVDDMSTVKVLTMEKEAPTDIPSEKDTNEETTHQYDETPLFISTTSEKPQPSDESKPDPIDSNEKAEITESEEVTVEKEATTTSAYVKDKVTESEEEITESPIYTDATEGQKIVFPETTPQYSQSSSSDMEGSVEVIGQTTNQPLSQSSEITNIDIQTTPKEDIKIPTDEITSSSPNIVFSTDSSQKETTYEPESMTEVSETLPHLGATEETIHENDITQTEASVTKMEIPNVSSTETYTESPTEHNTSYEQHKATEKPLSDVTQSEYDEPMKTESADVTVTESPEVHITNAFDNVSHDEEEKLESYTESSKTSEPISDTKLVEPETTTETKSEFSETTPYFVELEEHTHQIVQETTVIPAGEYSTEDIMSQKTTERGDQIFTELFTDDTQTEKSNEPTNVPVESHDSTHFIEEQTNQEKEPTTPVVNSYITTTTSSLQVSNETDAEIEMKPLHETTTDVLTNIIQNEERTTTVSAETEKPSVFDTKLAETTTKHGDLSEEKPQKPDIPLETTQFDQERLTTKLTTHEVIYESTPVTPFKSTIADEKPDVVSSTTKPITSQPPFSDIQPTEEIPTPDFPPSGYDTEPDYGEEDQAFGPGTCRYGGKVYVSAQQIPRDDPCDFCFCFRSDIICLQQSCPPPIHGCHEEPIQGFCCPRYECPVSMATTVNVTTTTTTTTTTLPPHFLPHAYKGAAQRKGCHIKGHSYKVGEVVRASSGPCLHCTCGGDGQMKCDPKACTPEPMLRQMIAAAVSAKRRR